ncbi:TIGR03905 family TSCPD domain-containing protein [Butyrivibrio sp. MC2013]|uniref:TIGR03905 family TSCPD domain-containing protein n=1 Tax=Butyrivibrio sp. MC2013 TaxID=1280686 RepID=UPI0003FB6388|nr:TIGR03905 family TSCPD domain-containing protein [Butyrivibrio sp. MC2013]
MNTIDYKTMGTCASQVHVEIDDEGIIRDVRFTNGCSGNTQGVSRLAIGRPATEVADQIRGIKCGFKPTSCPDQLSIAIDKLLVKMRKEKAAEN